MEIINAEKNGARMHLKALIKGGANTNTFRNGVRVKEHFLHSEPLKLKELKVGDRVKRDGSSKTGNVTRKTAAKFAIDDGRSNNNPASWSIVTKGESKHSAMFRHSTADLDETCSRFFEEALPDLCVISSTEFEIDGNKYQVIGKLGEGTYGLVIKARDVSNNRDVAVKFMFGDEQNKARQQTELAMQYYLSCMLDNKPPPSGSALVPTIYTIANLKETRQKKPTLEILIEKNITSSLVGVMELLGEDLETLLIETSNDAKKIPIVQQVLKEVAQTLNHINSFSTKPVFVHGDLHTGNIMYTKKGSKYQFYIMDLGMSEIVHHGGRTESPNPDMYINRTVENWRHRGTRGNDLCMLCLSIVQMFEKALLDDLPELFRPILDYFNTTPPGDFKYYKKEAKKHRTTPPLKNALQIFLDESSAFYLGCDPGKGRWPLGKGEDKQNLPLFHYFGYDMVDEDSDVTDIFSPVVFLSKYLTVVPSDDVPSDDVPKVGDRVTVTGGTHNRDAGFITGVTTKYYRVYLDSGKKRKDGKDPLIKHKDVRLE